DIINTHNYQAMYYPDGSYAGINEIVFNFKPWLDWYLQTTGQRLVSANGAVVPPAGAPAPAAGTPAPSAGVDATSGASA
ncbi:MAG: NADPH-dependent FMN reductase, partial [Atopobium sp.]|nr:NADPH-dependent FMN reductase [Atopobium sp.]